MKSKLLISVLCLIGHFIIAQPTLPNCFGPPDNSDLYWSADPSFAGALAGFTNSTPILTDFTGGNWTIDSGPGNCVSPALCIGSTASIQLTGPGTLVVTNVVEDGLTGMDIGQCTQSYNVVEYARNRTENVDISTDCPYRVVLVIDESGSIANEQNAISDVETAVLTLATELANTSETEMALIEFESLARLVPINGVTGLQPVDATFVSGVSAYLSAPSTPLGSGDDPRDPMSYTPGEEVNLLVGGTNWEDAFIKANLGADLVIFITDGNPTNYNDVNTTPNVTGEGNSFDLTAMVKAQEAANILKSSGAHLLILGVGQNLLTQPIIEVSGDDSYALGQNTAAFCAGDFSITDFGNLEACVIDIANQLSGKQVCEEAIPTMGQWGLMSLFLTLLIFGIVAIKQKQTDLAI